jgi:hypothetical protein
MVAVDGLAGSHGKGKEKLRCRGEKEAGWDLVLFVNNFEEV